jgi:hypothetical protein
MTVREGELRGERCGELEELKLWLSEAGCGSGEGEGEGASPARGERT